MLMILFGAYVKLKVSKSIPLLLLTYIKDVISLLFELKHKKEYCHMIVA